MPAREGAIPTKCKILDAAEKTIFHFTDRIFIASLKYFSELSIHSVSKKKTDNSHLVFRCSWVRVFVHVLLYFF